MKKQVKKKKKEVVKKLKKEIFKPLQRFEDKEHAKYFCIGAGFVLLLWVLSLTKF